MGFIKSISRTLTTDKTVDSRPLNAVGLQLMRICMARGLYKLRPFSVDEALQEKIDELRREGMVLFENFLPDEHFQQLVQEAAQMFDHDRAKIKIHQHGPNTVEVAAMSGFAAGKFLAAEKFFADPRLKAVITAAEKRHTNGSVGHTAAERLTQGPPGHDPESELHSDIFFNTHKAWLYLTDVRLEHGPLVYVKRSHALTLKQLGYAYRESVGPNKGSRRITQQELDELGLKETVLTVPKNTLVVANTCGYHRRLRGEPGNYRMSLHVSMRVNPFAFWR